MNRRSLLRTIPATLVIGSAGCTEIEEAVGGTGPISDTEWHSENDLLAVEFQEEHETDWIAFAHSQDDNETATWVGDAPRFEGPVDVPARLSVACEDTDYPNQTFQVRVGTGYFDVRSEGYEQLGSTEVESPDEWLEETEEISVKTGNCMAIYEGDRPPKDDGEDDDGIVA